MQVHADLWRVWNQCGSDIYFRNVRVSHMIITMKQDIKYPLASSLARQ